MQETFWELRPGHTLRIQVQGEVDRHIIKVLSFILDEWREMFLAKDSPLDDPYAYPWREE